MIRRFSVTLMSVKLLPSIVLACSVLAACGGRADQTTTLATTSTTREAAVSTTVAATTATEPDTTPPELTVIDPEPNAVVFQSVYTFRGTTEPGAAVVAAGRYAADVADDGSWSVVLVLTEGGNLAVFVATDSAGNEERVSLQVAYHPQFEGDCGDLPRDVIPDGVSDLDAGFGDVDGDGRQDTITVYNIDGVGYLHFALGYGWSVQSRLARATPGGVERVVDMGGPVVLLRLDESSDGSAYGLYALHGCEIVAVPEPDGSVPTLFRGFRDSDAGWFSCSPDGVTQVLAFIEGGEVHAQFHEYLYDPAAASVTEVSATETVESGSLSDVTARLMGVYPSCVDG